VYWGIVLIHGSAPRETIHECHTHAVSQLVLMFETRPVLTMAPSLTYLIYFAVTPFHHTHTDTQNNTHAQTHITHTHTHKCTSPHTHMTFILQYSWQFFFPNAW